MTNTSPKAAAEHYATELTEILELRDVPPVAITQIVREVHSHVAESGEDPVAAFGPARDYADNFAPSRGPYRFWLLVLGAAALASGGAYVLLTGALDLLSTGDTRWGLPPWARITVGAIGILGFIVLVGAAGARSRRRTWSWRL